MISMCILCVRVFFSLRSCAINHSQFLVDLFWLDSSREVVNFIKVGGHGGLGKATWRFLVIGLQLLMFRTGLSP